MSVAYILASAIMMTVMGLAVGNYATSLVFRLPRGLKIANDPPYCDSCRTYLETRDMFPFFSWVASKGKCRFCAAPVPALYAYVELGCALLFNAAWFAYGMSETFLLLLGVGVFLITQGAIYYAEGRLFTLLVVLVAAFGAVLRTRADETIYGFIASGYLGLMLGVALWGILCLRAKQRVAFPASAIALAVGAWCLPTGALPAFALYAALAAGLVWMAGAKDPALRRSAGVIGIAMAQMALLIHPPLAQLA